MCCQTDDIFISAVCYVWKVLQSNYSEEELRSHKTHSVKSSHSSYQQSNKSVPANLEAPPKGSNQSDYQKIEDNMGNLELKNIQKIANSNPKQDKPHSAIQALKKRIIQKGEIGLISYAFLLKKYSKKNMIHISMLKKLNEEFDLKLPQDVIESLIQFYDRDGSSLVKIFDIIDELKGDLNENRKFVINNFLKELKLNNPVNKSILFARYKPNQHPDVLMGRKIPAQIQENFIQGFGMHRQIYLEYSSQNVSAEEMISYLSLISASFESDIDFMNNITSTWGLPSINTPVTSVNQPESIERKYSESSSQSHNEKELKVQLHTGINPQEINQLIFSFRNAISIRGPRGYIGFLRELRRQDIYSKFKINKINLLKAIKDFRLKLLESEVGKLFDLFDEKDTGEINYRNFYYFILGDLPESRKNQIIAIFRTLDKKNSKFVNIDLLKQTFNAEAHPDVITKKRREDDVLTEFLDVLEYIHNLIGKSNEVSEEEFLEIYKLYSICDSDEYHFANSLANTWKH